MHRCQKDRQSEWFAQYEQNVALLKRHIPELVQLCQEESLDDSQDWQLPTQTDAWHTLLEKYEDYRAVGPLLIASLYGPSGGGKSAIFRLLTGCEVPSGAQRRPISFASAVALPAEAAQDVGRLQRIFRDRPVELMAPRETAKLSEKSNSGKIFVIPCQQADGAVAWALADVPDFNSVEKQNWEECRYILSHAHVVLFVVYSEAYSDEKTVSELERCCELASQVIYVLTKVDSEEQAREIWEDLLKKLADRGSRRSSDGKPIGEILRKHGFYYSIRYGSTPPRPGANWDEIIRPGLEGMPPFSALLRGLEAQRLVLRGLLLPVAKTVEACGQFLNKLQQTKKQLQEALEQSQQPIRSAAKQVAGSQFPIGVFVKILAEQVQTRGTVLRWMTRKILSPLAKLKIISSSIEHVKNWLQTNLAVQKGEREEKIPEERLQRRSEFEKKQLLKELENLEENKGLFIAWRSRFPEQCRPDGLLSQKRLATIRQEFEAAEIPEPSQEWESFAREEVTKWMQEHPWLARSLWLFQNVTELAALGLFVMDISVSGGIVGTFGLTSLAAAGSLAAKSFLSWAERWNLKRVVEEADNAWRRTRTKELQRHLETHLWAPVFAPWQTQLEKLQALETPHPEAPDGILNACQSACDALESLCKQLHQEEPLDA